MTKTVSVKSIVNEAMQFGSCYLGSEKIMGSEYMVKRVNKVWNYIKKNNLHFTNNVYTYYNDKLQEWYVVVH